MTKDQTRMTNEIRMTKSELGIRHCSLIGHSGLGIGHYAKTENVLIADFF